MRYAALDAWRGVLALIVALYHLSVLSHLYGWPIVARGGLAVDFFFVLSGFVIAHAYGGRIDDAGSAGRFMVRRFGRVYPLHFAMLGALVGLEGVKLLLVRHAGASAGDAPFTGAASVSSIFSNLVLLQAMGLEHAFTWNGPSWSISVEFYTYVLFAVVTATLRGRARAAAEVLLTLAAGAFLAEHVLRFGNSKVFDTGFVRAVFGFFLGALSYGLSRKLPPLPAASGLEIAAVVAAALGWSLAPGQWLVIGGPLAFAPLILIFAQQQGVVSRVLLTRPAQWLGERSYSVYMTHFVVISVVNAATRVAQSRTGHTLWHAGGREPGTLVMDIGGPWAMDGLALAVLATVLVVSAVTYRLIEVPGRNVFNALASGAGARRALGDAFRRPPPAEPKSAATAF